MSVTVDQVKCACSDCVRVVRGDKGVKRDGRIYCSDECADDHMNGARCRDAGCACHG